MTPGEVTRALERLAETRRSLMDRPATEIAECLGTVGERFQNPDDPLTRRVVDEVRSEAGFSAPMVRRIVEGMARDWTRDRLTELLHREFPDPTVLDGFRPDPRGGRALRALGDRVAVHLGAGSVPGVSATSMIRSLLVKTPVLVKPGRGDRGLTRGFHDGLKETDPALAGAAEVAYWDRDEQEVLEAAVRGASRLVVYGSDAAVAAVRRLAPVTLPTVVYHHRFSVVVLGPAARAEGRAGAVQDLLAWAASTFDQRGCVSPHRVYTVGLSDDEVVELGRALAGAMALERKAAPAGALDPDEAARLQQFRAELRMRAALDPRIGLWASPDLSWTVVVDPEAEDVPYGHPGTLVLQPVVDRADLMARLEPLGPHLQSVGMEGVPEPEPWVEMLTEMGVTRVVPLGELPFPPAWWIHDGRGPLRALVRWTEWSGP